MNAQDRDYYVKRASQEDAAAVAATSLAARSRHEELARLYRARILSEDAADGVEPFSPFPARSEIEAA